MRNNSGGLQAWYKRNIKFSSIASILDSCSVESPHLFSFSSLLLDITFVQFYSHEISYYDKPI